MRIEACGIEPLAAGAELRRVHNRRIERGTDPVEHSLGNGAELGGGSRRHDLAKPRHAAFAIRGDALNHLRPSNPKELISKRSFKNGRRLAVPIVERML